MLQSKIRRGEMDRSVTFIQKVIVDSDTNEDKISSWIEVDDNPTVAAKIEDLRGNDVVIADRLTYVQNTRATIDYRSDITTQNRMVLNGKVYEIVAVTMNNSSRDRYQDLMCNLLDNEEWS